jgi:hypothetical protein
MKFSERLFIVPGPAWRSATAGLRRTHRSCGRLSSIHSRILAPGGLGRKERGADGVGLGGQVFGTVEVEEELRGGAEAFELLPFEVADRE